MAENYGKVVQVIGPTVDVEFGSDYLPAILNALIVEDPKRTDRGLTVEVAQHLGAGRVGVVHVLDHGDERSVVMAKRVAKRAQGDADALAQVSGRGHALDHRAVAQLGGGIVADSDPRGEQEECENKAKALLAAVPTARRMTTTRRAAVDDATEEPS